MPSPEKHLLALGSVFTWRLSHCLPQFDEKWPFAFVWFCNPCLCYFIFRDAFCYAVVLWNISHILKTYLCYWLSFFCPLKLGEVLLLILFSVIFMWFCMAAFEPWTAFVRLFSFLPSIFQCHRSWNAWKITFSSPSFFSPLIFLNIHLEQLFYMQQ